VHAILISIKRLVSICFQALNQCFLSWTKPSHSSLLLGTVADLGRTKSELVAENALLRQQLIVLRRHVKRPVYAKTDRLLLVLLARMVRTWKQALFIVQEDDAPALASSGIEAVLEVHIQISGFQTEDLLRDRGVDQRDGPGQSIMGSRTDPWRIPQAGAPRLQTYHSEGHEACSLTKTARTDLGHLPAEPCPRYVGV
jgi:hypothetical protein